MPAYGAAPYLPAIVLERPVYLREMSDGLYSPFTYLLYKVRHGVNNVITYLCHVNTPEHSFKVVMLLA